MKFNLVLRNTIFAVVASAPTGALAHVGGDGDLGLASGLAHPISGMDHVFAMLMVGLLAVQVGGRATWRVPVAFILAMVFGGALGAEGVPFPFVEVGIAASVVVLGSIVALSMRIPVAIATGLAALFAIFHGYAHGLEMPHNASGITYAIGFVLTSSLLMGVGVFIGTLAIKFSPVRIVKPVGAAAALAGLLLLKGAI